MGQPNPVAVLDKAVAILRAVADEPATLAELVAAPACPGPRPTGWPSRWRGTGWSGAPPRAPGRPGPALAELGRGGADLADLAGRHLAALRDASGESAQFYVRRRRHPRLRRRRRAHQRAARHRPGRRPAADDRRLRRARAARLHPGRGGHPPAAVRQLHRPHAARGPPPRLGAQRRRARARRGLAVGAGARRLRARCSARCRSPVRSSGWAAGPARRSSARCSTPPPRSPAPRARALPPPVHRRTLAA